MQPLKYIVNNLTINVYDDKSSASFIKKQKSKTRTSQKKERQAYKSKDVDKEFYNQRPNRRERSVEMYDEGVYADDVPEDTQELEKIDWPTLVSNTAAFHSVFAPQKPAETFDEYMENRYTEVDEDAIDDRIENDPYHQEMLQVYAEIYAKVCEDMKKERENGIERKEYTCCTGCLHSNGTRPFHFCKRSYAANYPSDDEEDDYEEEE